MSNTQNRMIVFVSILGAILATGLLALNPSTSTNAQAIQYDSEDYDDRYSYGNQYGDDNYYRDDNRYGYDNDHQKKISNTDNQKINCIISNINVNGIDITQIPQDGTTTAAAANEAGAEGTVDAANTQNDNGLPDRINFDRNLVNVCVNNNNNEQTRVTEPAGPETASLTVIKEIFGCANPSETMDCQQLPNNSPLWLPCIGSSISSFVFCTNLPPNLFDIQVLDDQNTQIDEFVGSTVGTTIQNLQPGTYTVNEIKHLEDDNQLGENPIAFQACTNVGFPDGGSLLLSNVNYRQICFEYEDETNNDCSTVTLAAGEQKTCTVKNYISLAQIVF